MLKNHFYEGKIEAGCDEAGRGCLAGAVYAAAVILPDNYQNERLNDSKQLTEKKRYALREEIERDAVAWAVGVVTAAEIDRMNILNASILAMHRALDQLKVRPEAIIVDGNRFKPYRPPLRSPSMGSTDSRTDNLPVDAPAPSLRGRKSDVDNIGVCSGEAIPHTTIVKGDGKYLAIAAASILAKTYRDDYMNDLDKDYPAYQWKKNKGYPTKAHYAAIREFGPSPYHRLTFKGVVDTQLEIDFGQSEES